MNELILTYLFGVIASAVVLFISLLAYVRGRSERQKYEVERSLLPDAVRLERLVEMRSAAEKEYEDLQEAVLNAKLILSERDDAENWLKANRDKLLQLKADRENQEELRRSLETLQDRCEQADEKFNSAQDALSKIKVELEYFQNIKEQKDQELAALEDSKNHLLEQRNRVESDLQPLRIKAAGIQQEIDSRREELEKVSGAYERRVKQFEGHIAQNQKLLEQTEGKLADSRSTLDRLAIELRSAKEEAVTLSAELDTLRQDRTAMQESVAQLAEQRNSIESKLQPLRVMAAGIHDEIDLKKAELAKVVETCQRRISQYEEHIAQNKQLFEQSEERLAVSAANLEQVANELRRTKEERSAVSADVQALQREKVALEDLIKNLRADWNTVLRISGQDEGADARRTEELWSPYIVKKANEFGSVESSSELKQLERTEEYLRSKSLYFPKRVLHAFHTSLKVTDISPFVVLAGISGTGKSELPRRYAEAMGLHFLNVAVQPRWDSPQDMFGFFNYLENRYRATELARGLVQMDPFYKEEGRGWTVPDNWGHSLSSQMLLVLLDEMNLARVEYYFSEFLSKLETRRGIIPHKAESRQKAEIGLEVGAGKSKSPIMQLFVDRNVLFVGTMNEDETTQALSDKVVDRANVLRFGRPGKVDAPESTNRQFDIERRLSFADWNSWHETPSNLSAPVLEMVTGHIDNLDRAMAKIKRPFGFRTRNSILSYVANYPSMDNDFAECALADQIEQKIIPKFRGLDPRDQDVRDSINEVRAVLEDLRDGLLVDALDQTTRESQFVWLGVNRFEEEYQRS